MDSYEKSTSTGSNSLHMACKAGSIKSVRYLIDVIKMDPTLTTSNGDDCLHLAI